MKKTLPKTIVIVVLICVVVAVCFLVYQRNRQDIPSLNYKNLVSIAAQFDTLMVSKSEDEKSYIIDGTQLSQFLDTAEWSEQIGFIRNIQRDTDRNSKSSIQLEIDGIYLKLFDTDTANIYDETIGKDRYYQMSDGDYEKIFALLRMESAN